MFKILSVVAIGALTMTATTSSEAAMAKSLDYELEYSSVNAGSASTDSAGYSIVSIITTDGVAGGSSSSTSGDYEIEPLVGSASEPLTSVNEWMLY